MKKPAFKSKSGIYFILCFSNLKFYIGRAGDLSRRFREHHKRLRNNKHHNNFLQNSWNKYGERVFVFGVLEYCDASILVEREQAALDKYRPFDLKIGFNGSDKATGPLIACRKSTKEKISDKLKGRVMSEETKEKIRKTLNEKREEFQDYHIERFGVEFEIVSPTGEVVKTKGVNRFARDHGMKSSELRYVLKGEQHSVKGWKLPSTYISEVRAIRDPSGIEYNLRPGEYKSLAEIHNLDISKISAVAQGKRKSHKGWTKVTTK